MVKAYRRRDRTWRECITLEEFQRIARETVGRERPNKEADDWCKDLFGKVASPGVKHPHRRKQREEAILDGLERVEGSHRDGGHKTKDHNSKKRKRTVDSGHPKDKRPNHRESTYLENVGWATEGSPPKAVFSRKRGPVSPIPPVTPTRPRLSRRLAPLGSMTNVTLADPMTPKKSPLDDRGRNRPGSGEFGKEGGLKDSKVHLGGNPDPFVDEEDHKGGDGVGLSTNRPFVIHPPAPLLSPPTTTPRRKRMDLRGDADPHAIPSDTPMKANFDAQPTSEQTTPLAPQISPEGHSQSIAGRSLPTPVSNGPIKRAPPPASSPTTAGVNNTSTGVKRKREAEEDVHYPSKKVVAVRSSPSMQELPGPSRGLKPSETWSLDERTFMEEPYSTRKNTKSKIRRGEMSVDAIKTRLIKATSTPQIIPVRKPDAMVQNPTVIIEACNTESKDVKERTDAVAHKKLEGNVEPDRRKAGPSALTFGIPAPFPPGTSGPGSSLDSPNNSDKIAAYHGADKFYSSRPPPSTTPPQPANVSELAEEDEMLFAPSPGEDAKHDATSRGQPEQLKPEDSKKAIGRFPSLILEPRQLLFTDTAVGKLMSTSVVWFARDAHATEPLHRPSSLQLVPELNEVSRIESLLVACGWHGKKAFTSKRGIERGVVFVDYEEQTDIQPVIKTHWVAQQCENAYLLATRYRGPTERGMRPIWIMDARVLRWERLRSMKSGDTLEGLEEFVLWKKE